MIGGSPEVVTAGAVAGLVVLVGMVLFRSGRRSSAAVRVALWDPYPETRRAAVVVAARHGLATHARLLVAHARQEKADEVLFTLAALVRDRGCTGRGSRAKLRRWSESFLSERGTPASGDGATASPHFSSGQELVPALDTIDALEMFEAVSLVEPPAPGGAGPAPRWTAGPGELDPLAVVASLEAPPCTMWTTRAPSPRGREPERGGDHEALVDRLAGIGPTPRPMARPRTTAPPDSTLLVG